VPGGDGAAKHEEAHPYSSVTLGFVVLESSVHASRIKRRNFVMLRTEFHPTFMLQESHERRTNVRDFGVRRSRFSHARLRASYLFICCLVGLPLLNGFIGEFLVLSGRFQAKAIYGVLAATGVI